VSRKGDVDPLTHILLTRRLIGTKLSTTVAGGIAPDLPFYLLYPAWVAKQRKVRYALATNDWPAAPQWMGTWHHVFHSLPLTFAAALLCHLLSGQWPREILYAWILHILVDIPTHSRRHWGPRFLWPLSDVVVDGVSWGDIATLAFARLVGWREKHTKRGRTE
jgi:hypothetical protein